MDFEKEVKKTESKYHMKSSMHRKMAAILQNAYSNALMILCKIQVKFVDDPVAKDPIDALSAYLNGNGLTYFRRQDIS